MPRVRMLTKWLPTKADCIEWYDQAKASGRPAAIISRGKHPAFSVWISGNSGGDTLRQDYRIEESCNNFGLTEVKRA